MRKLAILILGCSACFAYASGNSSTGSFDANNEAQFSGYQSYTQNNYTNGDNYRINNVTCPVPTMFVGGNGAHNDYKGHDPQSFGVSVGVTIPLFTDRCQDAANAELKKMQWHLQDAKVLTERRAEQHKVDLMRICVDLMEKGYEMSEQYCQGVEQVFTPATMTEQLFVK